MGITGAEWEADWPKPRKDVLGNKVVEVNPHCLKGGASGATSRILIDGQWVDLTEANEALVKARGKDKTEKVFCHNCKHLRTPYSSTIKVGQVAQMQQSTYECVGLTKDTFLKEMPTDPRENNANNDCDAYEEGN